MTPIPPGHDAIAEWEILLLCARSRPEPALDERLRRLFAGPIDWGRLIRMAWINRMIPLLHWHVLRLGVAMPDWSVEHLAETKARNDDRGRRLIERFVALVEALDAAKIPAITFKGPTLEALAYAHPGQRECADLDILVHEPDLRRLVPVIEGLGYRFDDRFGPLEERIFRRYHFAYEFVDPTGAANIDAHWRLLPGTWTIPLDYEGLWQRSGTTQVGGRAVRVLADEDLLFYLALHSTKERWLRLRMVCDVAELLRARPMLDWNRALSDATAQGGRRILLLAAHLAATWLGAPVPDPIRAHAGADRLILRFEREIWASMQSGKEDFSRLFDLSWFRFLVLDRFGDRIGYIARTLALPRVVHTQIVKLPTWLAWAYIPIKLGHDYVLLPVWKLIQRWRPQPRIARTEDGPR